MISMDREYRHAHTLQERLGQKIMRSLIIIPTGIPEDDNRIIRRKPKSFFELEQFFYISVRVAGIVNQCCQILSVLNDVRRDKAVVFINGKWSVGHADNATVSNGLFSRFQNRKRAGQTSLRRAGLFDLYRMQDAVLL